MGRPRKPEALRRRDGYPGHSRPPAKEPEPPPYTGGTPAYLEGLAKQQWTRICKLLKEMEIFTEADVSILEAYCLAYATFREATDKLKTDGQVIKTAFGPARNPWANVQKDAWAMMEKSGSKLGLSPVDRAKLAIDPDPDKKVKKGLEEFFGPQSTARAASRRPGVLS